MLLLVKRSDNFSSMLIVLQLYLTELPLKSPYTCTCTKEIWLLLQLLIERLHENGGQTNSFWHYFDAALNLHRERKSMNGKVSSNRIKMTMLLDQLFFTSFHLDSFNFFLSLFKRSICYHEAIKHFT